MIAIETRYLGATNYKPARYVATTCNGQRVTRSADDALNADENHAAVAEVLAACMGWRRDAGRLVGGGTKAGMCFVYVPAPTLQRTDDAAPVYSIEAGRSILRNGERFASIGRAGPDVNPCALDKFARDVVDAMNARGTP